MANRFSRIALLGRYEDERVGPPMVALAHHLLGRGVSISAEHDVAQKIGADGEPTLDEAIAGADLAIAIGGDGTMLFAAPTAARHGVPILGVNRGRLGFLADLGPDEMLAGVDDVLAGRYTAVSRLMLRVHLPGSGADTDAIAMNDIVLQKVDVGRMLEFETWIDGDFVNTHGADGLIVASPTGSTAYALSCGGPILAPQLDTMVLVPVCPHTLSDRPIVIHSGQEVELRLGQRRDDEAQITADGHLVGKIGPGESIRVAAAEQRVELIHPPSHDYYQMLRQKLRWGRGRHARPGDI